MANVLFYGNDDRVPTVLTQYFENRQQEKGEINSLAKINDEKKLGIALMGVFFDLILIDHLFLPRPAPEWLESFKKLYPGQKQPIILCGDEKDPVKILKFVSSGWTDYIVNPPDKPLLIEKINMYVAGKRDSDQRQVYSLQMSQPADMAKPGNIEELSEFDCKIRTSAVLQQNDFMILYSKAFGADMNGMGSVLGRCYDVQEHAEFKGQFIAKFYFVGVTTDILTNIRTALRKSYVASKQK